MSRLEFWLVWGVAGASVLTGAGWDQTAATHRLVHDLVVRLQAEPEQATTEVYHTLWRLGPTAAAAAPAVVSRLRWKQRSLETDVLLAIGPRASVPPLVDALGGEDVQRAAVAAWMLGVFGPAASSARPALLAAAGNPALEAEVARALDAIDGVRPATGGRRMDR